MTHRSSKTRSSQTRSSQASSNGAVTALLALTLLVTFGLGGCRSARERELAGTPDGLYDRASKSLSSGNYDGAVRIYEALEARYPFSDAARQSRLDIMYAYYKKGEKEQAVDAADTFIRENPTHPRIDYAYYVKGLVYFERTPNILERTFDVDLAERPPQDARQSFDAFSRVVTQYPKSEYAPDARQRMIYLRNRLAEYEIGVARYYIKRGAWVGAANRARYVIENYDGAPAVRDALEISIQAYDKLGLKDLAGENAKVLAANFPERAKQLQKKRWWKFW